MVDWVTQDLNRYEREQAWWDDNAPECCECGSPVGDTAYKIGDDIYCDDCMESHRIDVTEYIEDVAYEQQMREYEYAQDAKSDWGDNEWKEREIVDGKRG